MTLFFIVFPYKGMYIRIIFFPQDWNVFHYSLLIVKNKNETWMLLSLNKLAC